MEGLLTFFVGMVVGFFSTAVVIVLRYKAAENKRNARFELEDRMAKVAKREFDLYGALTYRDLMPTFERLNRIDPPKRRKGDKK